MLQPSARSAGKVSLVRTEEFLGPCVVLCLD
jgi:hypothetical protein